ncbi:hypothetical protein BO85DRAFT_473876 [Aspergillus piperis CBS 112811]|uniref:Uncharacterized protein n=1 Tax=Aspergillus piperis CBS 112811 TaxID=1448313 RepID=A0A8G1RDX8_9EURO|nr:hypothetical protein BO85DRAFT_473876 [Aspergillus piperis CBS 112811]RAH63312.1 hypothetical protein BO85DRAFT_473876 [Aspergillus piperis CBS 112811]
MCSVVYTVARKKYIVVDASLKDRMMQIDKKMDALDDLDPSVFDTENVLLSLNYLYSPSCKLIICGLECGVTAEDLMGWLEPYKPVRGENVLQLLQEWNRFGNPSDASSKEMDSAAAYGYTYQDRTPNPTKWNLVYCIRRYYRYRPDEFAYLHYRKVSTLGTQWSGR